MKTGTTLYYPYIHPRSTAHLKAALIYWDRVRRIVPKSITHGAAVQGDDDDSWLLTDRGLLVSTYPEPYGKDAAKKFFEHIEPQSAHFRIDINTAQELARRNHGIHMEKIGEPVISRLYELGLAQQFGEWVSMRPEVGAFYMFCLASEMGERISAPLFTDSLADAALGQSLLFEPDTTSQVSEILVQVGVTLPSPEQLNQIPMKVIADFVQRHGVEKQQFREAVEGIIETARSNADPVAIDDYLSSHKKRIADAVKNLRASLDELKVGGIASAAKITVPAGAAAAIAALPISPIAAAILGATGITIAAISCYAETRGKLRQARTATPYHYLISVADELNIDVIP
jgi:hypothetical protein